MCIYCRAVSVLTLVGTRLRSARPLTILAVAWLVLIIYAFPGQMSADTYDHLEESRLGVYTDGHPPVMNVLFWCADTLIPGPFAVLVLNSTVFLAGLYAILRRTFTARRAAWIASVLFVFPPIMLPLAAVWKDSVMAAFLLLGIAGLLDSRRSLRLAALLAVFVATAVRYNAFAATFPFVVLLFEWRPGMHWLKRYAISVAAWVAVTMAAFTLNSSLTDKQMHYWHSSLGAHDIVGTLNFIDGTLPDAELEKLFEGTGLLVHEDIHAYMRKVYTPKTFMELVTAPKGLWSMPVYGFEAAPEPQRDAIERAWKQIVTKYPGAYVTHRGAVMVEVLSLTWRRPLGTAPRRDFPYPQTVINMGLSNRWSALQLEETSWMIALNRFTPAFEPWMYLAMAFFLLFATRRNREVFAFLTSAIIMESSLLVLAPSPDYRYSHWLVVCVCISITLLVTRGVRAARAAQAA